MARTWGSAPAECERIDALLESYLDEELTIEQVRAVDLHLEGCDSCREELALAESVATSLRSLTLVTRSVDGAVASSGEPPVDPQSVHRRWPPVGDEEPSVGLEQVPPRSVRPIWNHPLLQAAAVLLLLSGVWFAISDAPFVSPSASDRLSTNGNVSDSGTEAYSEAELLAAREDLRVALSYFGGLAAKAGIVVRDDVLGERVAVPTRRAFRRLGGLSADPSAGSADSEERSAEGPRSTPERLENDSS